MNPTHACDTRSNFMRKNGRSSHLPGLSEGAKLGFTGQSAQQNKREWRVQAGLFALNQGAQALPNLPLCYITLKVWV